MELYTIVGLTATTQVRRSCETDSTGRVLLDASGIPLAKMCKTTDYTLYLYIHETYLGIHLFERHGVSACGHLCTFAHMEITEVAHPEASFTHVPIQSPHLSAKLVLGWYHLHEEMDVYVYDDPSTRVFRFSGRGSGNEAVPDGHIIVNMDLFREVDLPVDVRRGITHASGVDDVWKQEFIHRGAHTEEPVQHNTYDEHARNRVPRIPLKDVR